MKLLSAPSGPPINQRDRSLKKRASWIRWLASTTFVALSLSGAARAQESGAVRVDFGPAGSPLAAGYTRDAGATYAAAKRFGWSKTVQLTARGTSTGPLLDTC